MKSDNAKMISKLYLSLLPIQVLLMALTAVSGIISSIFASNVIGPISVSAMGVYHPVYMTISAVNAIFLGGAQILCGKFMGQNQVKETRSVFSLDILFIFIISIILTVMLYLGGKFDLTGFLASDEVVRHEFNIYLIGLSAGIIPFLLGQQLFAFLSLEQKNKLLIISSLVYIVSTVLFSYLFIIVLPWGTLGLGLSAAAGNWAFFIALLPYFLKKDSLYHFSLKLVKLQYLGEMLTSGLPTALNRLYQAIRGLIINALILHYVGAVGLSAFGAANSLMDIFWSVPFGLEIVSRVLFSVAVGEEDRRSLADIMRTVFYRALPLNIVLTAFVAALAVPFTKLFYQDPGQEVYQMTVGALRILPLAFAMSLLCLSFNSFAQTIGKNALAHVATLFDGVLSVAGCTAILIGSLGIYGFYWGHFIGGIISFLVFVVYACIKNKHFPKNMEELMVIPKDFGADVKDRLELSVRNKEDVVKVAETVQQFCASHEVEAKKAYYAALCMEEMAGNIIEHGFKKDNKKHRTDIRVTYKEDGLILRIKDDCKPFDPAERKDLISEEDLCKNIGIRMVYKIADDVSYQHTLGLNVLTMKVGLN